MREIVILLGAEVDMQSAYERCADWPQAEDSKGGCLPPYSNFESNLIPGDATLDASAV